MEKNKLLFSWIEVLRSYCRFRFVMPKSTCLPYPEMQLSITPSQLRKALKEVRQRRKKYNCPQPVEDALMRMLPLFVEVNDYSDAKLTKRGIILFDEIYRMLVLYHKCVLAEYEFEKYIPQSREAFLVELNREMAEKYKTTFGFHAIVERDNRDWFFEIQKDGFLNYGKEDTA